jgi:tetratricopeptide (TPR) repeat protein
VRRAEPWRCAAVLATLLLVACGSSPKPPPEPRLRVQAQELETSGARRYAQGDYSAAARHFAEAARLRSSFDDAGAAARNRLQQAQAELALGQTQQALDHASEVTEAPLQVQALLLQVQAQLALGRTDAAQALLTRLITLCESRCAERGRVQLLQARTAWAQGQAAQAATQAEAALPLLREQSEEREVANAWRLLAAARLAQGDTGRALKAAQTALDLDRQLAVPEKIARDWLLIGDIQRRAASPEARAAYQRAYAVAQAAGLRELVQLAEQSIQETSR